MWSYLLVQDGYRPGHPGVLALTILATFGGLILTVKGLARRLNKSSARRRIAAILLGFGLLAGVFAIAIWSYLLLRDGYRVEIAGILVLMVSLVFFCLGLVSQAHRAR